jgi:hypothetical protein
MYLQNIERYAVVDTSTDERSEMGKVSVSGFCEIFIADRKRVFHDQIFVETDGEDILLKHDPSSFLSTLSSFDCYLFRQGKH